MKKSQLLAATALTLLGAPAAAQTATTTSSQNAEPTNGPGQEATGADASAPQNQGATDDIVVTAQRQSQRLQDVPIAVSAFTAENIERQQIVNPTALQQTLPNVTFTKTNFSSSSFTIRGVGDLCTGPTCDAATAIHVNDMPLVTTRLFESEFFDLERIEVLRGPQGTLFGRNATSGVVNFITAKPDLSRVHAAGELEYGNYNSKRVKGMLNLPITDTIGIRVAGTYLKRGGFTKNLYDDSHIDDRDLYSVRGTLSWEPDSDTRLDLIGYYFREKDNRSRIQKQLCHRDPTGVLGCLPDTLPNETSNGNASLASIFTSREFLGLRSASLAPFGLLSLYGPDSYVGVTNPADNRTVNVDFTPTYFADEEQYTAKFYHNFGKIKLNFTGGYTRNSVDAQTDYNLAVENPLINNSGLIALDALGRPGGRAAFLNGVRNTLIPNGPNGGLCQSAADSNNVGVYGGNSIGCFPQSVDFDRARQANRQYSAEAHIDSSFNGPFNFLLGGIYVDHKITQNDTFIDAFGFDYASGILGAASSQAIPGINGNAFLAAPFFRNEADEFHLKSYGIFGEGYVAVNNKLKLTLGLRYNHDVKTINQRNLLLSVLTPIGTTSIEDGPNYAAVDYDTTTPGIQKYSVRSVAFSRLTGRAVLDYRITRDNLLYVSYSRGYKSGGINPALPANVNFTQTFNPEKVDAFEIGSKNSFANGQLRLNLTGFYYKYNGLQLARLVNRTSVNDNINANIYGVEAEAIMRPVPAFLVNINASYQRSKVSDDKLLINTRDPSGGRSDAVIIKDITNASNCVVTSATPGNAAAANQYVAAVNGGIGLRAPVAIPSTTTTGAFGVCSVLASTAANPSSGLRALFATPTGALPFTVADGIPVNIRGNELPQAPTYKFSVGAQYTINFHNGMSLVPRADLNYTGSYTASIFNGNIDRVRGYEVVNIQIQLNGRDDRWYIRGFVQNLTANDAVTGQFIADQSAGLFTNIFTIEPRRYGVAAGFKF